MTEPLTEEFERRRPRLRRVAYRLLGSPEEAEDAVQEAWVRLHRSDTSEVANLDGWLTTVVARISLDMLRSRSSRQRAAGPARATRSSSARTASPRASAPEAT